MARTTDPEDIEDAITSGATSFVCRLPEDEYFHHLDHILTALTEADFEGVYVSFLRPCENLQHHFDHKGIEHDHLQLIDATTAVVTETTDKQGKGCTFTSPETDIKTLADIINDGLEQTDAERKFVLIDSITALSLYQPESSTKNFSTYLQDKLNLDPDTLLIINVPQGEQREELVQDIEEDIDRVIEHSD